MEMIFSTIQFIDSHSESIKHKNLIVVDGEPIWMRNAKAAKSLCDSSHGDNKVEKYCIKHNWICTTYETDIIPDGYGKRIPRSAINTGKCKLGDRVAGAVNYLNSYAYNAADAYVLLLGNVVSMHPERLIARACETWCDMKKMTPELTGLLSVTNSPMFGPGRALSLEHGLFARSVNPIDKRYGEEKQDEVRDSWFFDGGVMIMDAKNRLIDHTAVVMSDMSPSDWSGCGDFSTQFQYLGDCVLALKQKPLDSVEIDAPWQILLVSDKCKSIGNEIFREHAERIEGRFEE